MANQTEHGGLGSEVERLRTELSAVAAMVKDLAAERGAAIAERVRSKTDHLRDSAREAASNVEHKLENQLEERPVTVMLGVFALGAVLGALLSRKV